MSIFDQLAQQLNPESNAPEQHPVGILTLLAKSGAKPESTPLLGSAFECEQDQQLGLMSLLVKGD